MDPNSAKPPTSSSTIAKQPPADGQWTTGLFDCFEDQSNCCLTCFCPCVTFGRIAEIADKGVTTRNMNCLLYYAMTSIHCAWLYGARYRTKLRDHFSLPEEPYSDCFVHGCCCLCSITQEYRELQNRGIDPSIGWQANVQKWKQEGVKPPITEHGMTR